MNRNGDWNNKNGHEGNAQPVGINQRLQVRLLFIETERDTANQQQAFLRSEIERWGKLINQYGVTAD